MCVYSLPCLIQNFYSATIISQASGLQVAEFLEFEVVCVFTSMSYTEFLFCYHNQTVKLIITSTLVLVQQLSLHCKIWLAKCYYGGVQGDLLCWEIWIAFSWWQIEFSCVLEQKKNKKTNICTQTCSKPWFCPVSTISTQWKRSALCTVSQNAQW